MENRRVAITGMGMISAAGADVASSWNTLRSGQSAIGPIESLDITQLRFRNGAQVRGFELDQHFPGGKGDPLDRFAQFAVVAARQAIADSRLEITPRLAEKTAVITGSCIGGQSSTDAGYLALYQKNSNRMHPLSILRAMANAGASHISMEFGLQGPAYTVSSACSSSNHAIGQAFWMVRSGQVDVAITGGSEAPFCFGLLKAWEAMRVVAQDTCRPFSKGRQGLILGEGSAMLVLEPLDAAAARGAKVYGEIAGFGMSADAGHITAPTVEGPSRAMRAALADAGLAPGQVGYINAHGTGTAGNDGMETRAIRAVFGPHADKLLVSSTKSMHGHALGAAGALEAVATVMALREKIIPPTANFVEADPECDLDYVPNTARAAEVECALSNSFAFGGLNAVLAIRK
jgi:nodulation protein E